MSVISTLLPGWRCEAAASTAQLDHLIGLTYPSSSLATILTGSQLYTCVCQLKDWYSFLIHSIVPGMDTLRVSDGSHPWSSPGLRSSLYTTLRGADIRVVSVERETEDGKIRCKLHRVQLVDTLDFDALSYVWGDSKDTKTILVNDQPFGIAHSLYDFLDMSRKNDAMFSHRYKHSHDRPARDTEEKTAGNGPVGKCLLWWIDAICINKMDLTEKSEQIPKMGKIFSAATRVCVWLGRPENVFNQSSFPELTRALTIASEELAKKDCVASLLQQEVVWSTTQQMRKGLQIMDLPSIEFGNLRPVGSKDQWFDQGFHNLRRQYEAVIKHPWFVRTWTKQEFVLSSSPPLILIGNVTFSLDALMEVAKRMYHEESGLNEAARAAVLSL